VGSKKGQPRLERPNRGNRLRFPHSRRRRARERSTSSIRRRRADERRGIRHEPRVPLDRVRWADLAAILLVFSACPAERREPSPSASPPGRSAGAVEADPPGRSAGAVETDPPGRSAGAVETDPPGRSAGAVEADPPGRSAGAEADPPGSAGAVDGAPSAPPPLETRSGLPVDLSGIAIETRRVFEPLSDRRLAFRGLDGRAVLAAMFGEPGFGDGPRSTRQPHEASSSASSSVLVVAHCRDQYRAAIPRKRFDELDALFAFAIEGREDFRVRSAATGETVALSPYYLVWSSTVGVSSSAFAYQVESIELVTNSPD